MARISLLSLAVVATVISMHATSAKRSGADKKMVCYVGTWAMYRPGKGKFEMEDIDPHLCTHLMYGFAKLENNQLTIFDPWGDDVDANGGGRDGYRKFTGLKKKNRELKTLLAIGGWNEGSTKYSEMASSPSSRKTFIKSVVPILEKFNFDGLDLDWEYPTQRGGKDEDRENFSELVREMRKELDRHNRGYLLTAAVTPNIRTVEQSYEVPVLAENLDFVNVMCYDYHGFWDNHSYTGHNTPLYNHPRDNDFEPNYNANDTVHFWLKAGLPKHKLIMGMALYGRGFTLENPQEHGLYAPTNGGGVPEGPYTRQVGIWGYNEICEKFQTEKDEWKISINPYVKAPYAFSGRNWIGYEDVESIYHKAEYARNMDLGGAMVWSLETDDFRGECHGEKFILTNTIVDALYGGSMPELPERPQVVPEEDPEGASVVPIEQHETTTQRGTRPPRRTRPTSTTEAIMSGGGGGSSNGECTEEGYFPSGNCSGFYQCVRRANGFQKFEHSCPPGTAFNPQINNCDHKESVEGCGRRVPAAISYRLNGQQQSLPLV